MISKKILSLLLISNITASAQKLTLSAKAGFSVTNMSASFEGIPVNLTLNSQIATSVGVIIHYSMNKRVSINSEVCYCKHSSELSMNYPISLDDKQTETIVVHPSATISIPTLQIPIYIAYHASKKFSVDTGVYVSRLGDTSVTLNGIAAEGVNKLLAEYQISDATVETEVEKFLDNNLHRYDIGFLLGANYEIGKRFSVGLRYQKSALNILKDININDYLQHFHIDEIPSNMKITPKSYLSTTTLCVSYNL